MTEAEARDIARDHLSDKRFFHSQCVARCAGELALRLGADVDKAVIAGWLHDVMKEQEDAVLLKTLEGSDIMRDDYFAHYKPIWHAFAGAIFVQNTLNLPGDIADAIYYHTCGRPNMSPLEKSVFLADYISDDREFPGAAQVRRTAAEDIDLAVFQALQNSVRHLMERGKIVMPLSLDAYNYYAALVSKNKD